MTDESQLRRQVVEAADRLFYAHGVQAVGMDAVRAEAKVSLKRLYSLFASKDDLVIEVLRFRSRQWDTGIAATAEGARTPREKLLAVYDFLGLWFEQDGFRGCAFINSFGELGGVSPRVAEVVRRQKADFQRYVADLVAQTGAPPSLAPQLALLAEGAQTTAAIAGDSAAAADARRAAETLIDAALAAGAAR
ncbi:TetR/AcrR family transcriptional regulator [Streptomonospora sp. S1-112]|uniref:TetR/AcrR family transcriptional regulator n=1 Tax=Streptomonospora mangrovi TaxID=2883123 RepID=A0A9X3SGF7_9ACTN|nr:TetR/AcrR family transcriptional regulator [Streptomonospora mangrovi]MDA0566832.1 TetR/AcrR family transcriptional regulator [Streptomonospora mangrovi]